jgi:hypothetical protein
MRRARHYDIVMCVCVGAIQEWLCKYAIRLPEYLLVHCYGAPCSIVVVVVLHFRLVHINWKATVPRTTGSSILKLPRDLVLTWFQ